MSNLAGVAPHGDFNIHANESTHGPNNELAVYVICACGRGYSWELKMPGRELIAWLDGHGDDIPLDEEDRRVKAAARGIVFTGATEGLVVHDVTTQMIDGEPPLHTTFVTFTEGL